MKNFLLYLWQLPQNLLGLCVIKFTKAIKKSHKTGIVYWYTKRYQFGVSLGNYIIIGNYMDYVSDKTVKHEHGHQYQSMYLGWLYLLIVGLSSIVRNIWDRIAHRKWSYIESNDWYYSQFPERWADVLGGVKR